MWRGVFSGSDCRAEWVRAGRLFARRQRLRRRGDCEFHTVTTLERHFLFRDRTVACDRCPAVVGAGESVAMKCSYLGRRPRFDDPAEACPTRRWPTLGSIYRTARAHEDRAQGRCRRVLHGLIGLVKYALHTDTPPAVVKGFRRRQCLSCEHRHERHCRLCGCWWRIKTGIASEGCPARQPRWLPLRRVWDHAAPAACGGCNKRGQ